MRKRETLYKVFEMIKEVVSSIALFGKGLYNDLKVFMVDDNVAEQLAIEQAWPTSQNLLHTLHFF